MRRNSDEDSGAQWSQDARRGAALLMAVVLAGVVSGCGDGTGPVLDQQLVAGTYTLTTLSFDPQGSLAEVDVKARLGTNAQLIVSANGPVQIVYQDPVTSLFTTIQGNGRSTSNGLRIDFASNSAYASLLLSRRTDLVFDSTAETLSFDGDVSDGVDRARLLQLVPEWANEQLLNPTPGRLKVTFTR